MNIVVHPTYAHAGYLNWLCDNYIIGGNGPGDRIHQFPEEIVEIIEVAEESNNLENVLIESADALEAQTTRKLDLAVRMLEPLSLVLMAAMTLVIVLALLMPIFNMSSSVGG